MARGAGIAGSHETQVVNCTFVGNAAPGISALWRASSVRGCIIWHNSTPPQPSQIFADAITYCNIQGGHDGIGNIDADPMFVAQPHPGRDGEWGTPDDDYGDLRLQAESPCIDAGNNWGLPTDTHDLDGDGVTNELIPVDLDGNPRINADGSEVDTGCGIPAVVDMGAYEYQLEPIETVFMGDIDGSGAVQVDDLILVLADWGPCEQDCCLADLDLDGQVGPLDLALVLQFWRCEVLETGWDCDSDGISDECEADCDLDGLPDDCAISAGAIADCNDNLLPDACDIAGGSSRDCNENGIPDECEEDCNANGQPDDCDLREGAPDCNRNGVPDDCERDCDGNGVPDECDIDRGAPDCNRNGVLDQCESDCDQNGVPDECDIQQGEPDCNGNGIPDVCENDDCNDNGIPDSCDLDSGTSTDCNGNGILDECDLASMTSTDIDGNGIPDECKTIDCNANGISDLVDVATGRSVDCNGNFVPDECELDCNCNGVDDAEDIETGTSTDCNTDGVPDDCQPPTNDGCGTSLPLVEGINQFSTCGASAVGPAEVGCPIEADVWFRHLVMCEGLLTLTVDADFDAQIAVYGLPCASQPGELIECGKGQVTFAPTPGSIYRFRVGSTDGSSGSGTITLTCDQ
jgi:heat shock protein beta